MMGLKPLLSTLCLFLLAIVTLHGQVVDIPDPNLKNVLVNLAVGDSNGDGSPDIVVDLNGDGEIQVSEAEAMFGLSIGQQDISSLEGLEYFINLEWLDCQINTISEIPTYAFPNLIRLSCGNNLLKYLDLSSNEQLETVNCSSNQFTSIDLSANENLKRFTCGQTPLEGSFDTSGNPNLEWLQLAGTNVVSLDLSQNPLLELVNCSNSALTEVHLENNHSILQLWLNNNSLSNIDLSQCENLQAANLHENGLESLDVSLNANLEVLRVNNNSLSSLNLANGNNGILELFLAYDNPELNCITVDDVSYALSQECDLSNNTGWCIDEQTSYSLKCILGLDDIAKFGIEIFPNPAHDLLQIRAPVQWQVEGVYDLSGQRMSLDNSNVRKIDVSGLASGLYFVRLEGDDGSVVKRFLKG